jgi:hypothetical protein
MTKKVVCPTVAFLEYLWNGLMNFFEILNFSSIDKKKKSLKKSGKFIEKKNLKSFSERYKGKSIDYPLIQVSYQNPKYQLIYF